MVTVARQYGMQSEMKLVELGLKNSLEALVTAVLVIELGHVPGGSGFEE